MSTVSEPLQDRRAELSRTVLEAIEPLLEAGERYADVSVERIIRAVGISRSTFYVYFDDKGELLEAMARDVTADLAAAGRTWFEFPSDGTKAHLRDALAPLCATYRLHRTILGAITEAAAYDERIAGRHAELVARAVDGLAAHIAAEQASATLAQELHPRRTAEWLVAMFERGLHLLVGPADAERAVAVLDAATDVTWRVLYAGVRD